MRDNPPLPEGLFSGLPDHRVVAMEGRDAAAFAQAQFMSDVAGLPDGNWQWSGWLTPKGRVIALFALLKFDPQRLWLLLPDADPCGFVSALQRFVFRSKVNLAVRDDLQVAGCVGVTTTSAAGARIDSHSPDTVHLDAGAGPIARIVRITTTAPDPETGVAGAADQWKALDLACGLPRLPASQAGQWTPQQLSLDRLRAYSVRKGCYPGQEIVARTHFLGQAKRGLVLFDADGPVEPGSEVRDRGQALGTVVSAAGEDGAGLVLAVLPLERAADALSANGFGLRERAMVDGLAR